MPTPIGTTPDGGIIVLTDDGREVVVAPEGLPPELRAPVEAPPTNPFYRRGVALGGSDEPPAPEPVTNQFFRMGVSLGGPGRPAPQPQSQAQIEPGPQSVMPPMSEGLPGVNFTPSPPAQSAPGPSGGPLGMAQQAVVGAAPSEATRTVTQSPRQARDPLAGLSSMERAALAQKGEAVESAIAAGEAKAIEETAARKAEEALLLREAEKENALQADAQKDLRAQWDMVKQFQDELTKPAGQVDTNRWFASLSTGEKVLAGVATFLGGFSDGPNTALETIRSAIASDIQLQQRAIDDVRASREKRLASAMSLLGQMREAFRDESAARDAVRGLHLQAAAKTVDRVIHSTSSADVRAKGEALKAELLGEAASALNSASERAFDRNYKTRLLRLQEMEAMGKLGAGVDPELVVPNIGVVATKDDAKTVKDKAVIYDRVNRAINTLDEVNRIVGTGGTLSRDLVGKATTAASDLETLLLKDRGLGSLDAGAQQVIRQMSGGNPTAILKTKGGYQAALGELRSSIRRGFASELKYRIRPGGLEPTVARELEEAELKAAGRR